MEGGWVATEWTKCVLQSGVCIQQRLVYCGKDDNNDFNRMLLGSGRIGQERPVQLRAPAPEVQNRQNNFERPSRSRHHPQSRSTGAPCRGEAPSRTRHCTTPEGCSKDMN